MILKSYWQKALNFLQYPWVRLFSFTILVSFLYALLEWVFIITSPSFNASGMALMTVNQKFSMFFVAGLTISLFSLVVLIPLSGASRIFSNPIWKSFWFAVAKAIPAFILACLLLLLIDNFTYTVANIGIVSTMGRRRVIYAFFLLVFIIVIYLWIRRLLNESTSIKSSNSIWQVYLALSLLIVSGFLGAVGLRNAVVILREVRDTGSAHQIERPHIILLGGDGLNAAHMSLYGYERDTTPKLSELAQESLIAENAFPNATTSLGSITSILTGKLPATTRVLYRPDILVDLDAFRHLPGILKNQGYHTVEISFPYYADAYEANFQEAFDLVNNRSMESNPIRQLGWMLGGDYTAYFLSTLFERISSRLMHVFFIETMLHPYASVTTLPGEAIGDRERIDQLLDLIDNADSPLFIHVHMMGTHGPNFNPREQVYSQDKSQDEAFMIDFYDDAVLDFDRYVREVVDYLSQEGILDETILVVYTDHGMKYTTNDRLPLIFRFPHGQYSGVISSNVQNLDIPVTILDYLDLPIPSWMGGDSLLEGETSPLRFIYSSAPAYLTLAEENIAGREIELWSLDMVQIVPPFYQFGREDVVICHQWYRLNLTNQTWESGEIYGHTSPCEEKSMPATGQVQSELLQHLSTNGFDVTSLVDMVDSAAP